MEVLQSPREVARSSRKAFQCPSSPSSSCLPSSLYRKAERLLGSDEACELDLKKKNEKWDKLCPVPFQSNLSGSSPGCTSEPSLRILKYLDRWQTAKLIKLCQRHYGPRRWLLWLCIFCMSQAVDSSTPTSFQYHYCLNIWIHHQRSINSIFNKVVTSIPKGRQLVSDWHA